MKFIKQIKRFLEMHGFDIIKIVKTLWHIPGFFKDCRDYTSKQSDSFRLKLSQLMPVLLDKSETAGSLKGHYVHQDLWAARKIYKAKPKRHVDIGSRIDGFISSLLVFRDVEVVDIRPLESPYKELVFVQDDATQMVWFKDSELESVSCLHAFEHFGLGRYGDTVDPDSIKTFAAALSRVIRKQGLLYFSVPIGHERLEFNAQRVFNPRTILALFKDFELLSFAAVNDAGDYIEDTNMDVFANAEFSCGLFEFRKK